MKGGMSIKAIKLLEFNIFYRKPHNMKLIKSIDLNTQTYKIKLKKSLHN